LGGCGILRYHVDDDGLLRRLDSEARGDQDLPDLLSPDRDWSRVHGPRFDRREADCGAANPSRAYAGLAARAIGSQGRRSETLSSNGPDACHTGIGHFNTCQFIRGAERGVARACPVAAKVLVSGPGFPFAIGVAIDTARRLATLVASR